MGVVAPGEKKIPSAYRVKLYSRILGKIVYVLDKSVMLFNY